MELRKQKEIEHYDRQAQINRLPNPKTNIEGWQPSQFSSYRFCQTYLENKCRNKKLLDYGCGNGWRSILLGRAGSRVIGIDLSKNSLKLARALAKKLGLADKIKFLKMDCEQMTFPDDSFDIVWDGGTFSSLDIKKALPELARVLKPDGFVLGIETLGHNPFFNLNRKINQWRGRRTRWAVKHIFKIQDLKFTQKYFNKIETHFFHLTMIEPIDKLLLRLSWLQKYAFKMVLVFSEPKK